MEAGKAEFTDIDGYISLFPEKTRKKFRELRLAIKKSAPGALERISYRMPAFWLQGNLVYFAGYKGHIGFYPGAAVMSAFAKDVAGLKYAKGSVQFPLDRPLPLDLVARIVKFRVAQNLAKAAKGKPKTERKAEKGPVKAK